MYICICTYTYVSVYMYINILCIILCVYVHLVVEVTNIFFQVIYTLTENLGLGPVEAIELTTAVDQMVSSTAIPYKYHEHTYVCTLYTVNSC